MARFWRGEAGLEGFYPFVQKAAAYMRNPAPFTCARVKTRVGHDALLPWFGGGRALLVAQQTGLPASITATATTQPLYGDVVSISPRELFPQLEAHCRGAFGSS